MNATGYAILETAVIPIVHAVGLVRPKRTRPDLDPEAILEIASAAGGLAAHGPPLDLIVTEWPRVRRGSAQNPQDLLPLTAINAAVAFAVRGINPQIRWATLSADLWTRGKNKDLRQKAFLQRLAKENPKALKAAEAVQPPSLRHNAIDALHIAYEAWERKL